MCVLEEQQKKARRDKLKIVAGRRVKVVNRQRAKMEGQVEVRLRGDCVEYVDCENAKKRQRDSVVEMKW